jgi:hypothetical protein
LTSKYGKTRDDEWNFVKQFFFERFHGDLFSDSDRQLSERRIELARLNSGDVKDYDYLHAMFLMLAIARGTRDDNAEVAFERTVEIQDKIIDEFTEAMKNSILSRHYPPEEIVRVILFELIEAIRLFNKAQDENYMNHIDEKLLSFAEEARKNYKTPLSDAMSALNLFLEIIKREEEKSQGSNFETYYLKQIKEFQRRLQQKRISKP